MLGGPGFFIMFLDIPEGSTEKPMRRNLLGKNENDFRFHQKQSESSEGHHQRFQLKDSAEDRLSSHTFISNSKFPTASNCLTEGLN